MSEPNKCAVCAIECSGVCCSGKCRAKLQRTRTDKERTVETAHGQGLSEAHAGKPSHGQGLARGLDVRSDQPTRPPCKRLDVYCHACPDIVTCEYKAKQNTALPGDADYKGVCVETGGAWEVGA